MSWKSETLSGVDQGIARFSEFSISIVLTERINSDYYQDKLRELIRAWPILSTRMNRLRTKFIRSHHERLHTIWYYKQHSSTLRSKLPEFAGEGLPLSVDTTNLAKYFKLASLDVPTRVTMPSVFRLQVVQFADAAALKFTVQHPLCDAKGLFKIVSGYCDLLAGRKLPPLNPRAAMKVVNEDQDDSSDEEELAKSAASEASTSISAGSRSVKPPQYMQKGWGPFLMSGVTQWTHRPLSDPRVSKAILIPSPVMDHWRKTAAERGAKVSRNDLLMAWLYLCSLPRIKDKSKELNFSFVVNIEAFLQETGDLQNSWCFVPVPGLPNDLLELINRSGPVDALIAVASNIRSVLAEARSHKSVAHWLKQHDAAPIMSPQNFGTSTPNIRISSWSYVDLWALRFPTGNKIDPPQKALTPKWVVGNIDFCPAFAFVNLSLDDTVVTWNEERGYWLQGRLHQDVIDRLLEASATVLLDKRQRP